MDKHELKATEDGLKPMSALLSPTMFPASWTQTHTLLTQELKKLKKKTEKVVASYQ